MGNDQLNGGRPFNQKPPLNSQQMIEIASAAVAIIARGSGTQAESIMISSMVSIILTTGFVKMQEQKPDVEHSKT